MPVPDYQTLMLPVLRATASGEMRVGDVVEAVSASLGLSPDDRAQMIPSGSMSLIANRVHWAKTYLSKAGLLHATRRGHFAITPRGSEVLQRGLVRIDNAVLRQFAEFREFTKRPEAATSATEPAVSVAEPSETPSEQMRSAHKRIQDTLAQELLDRIRAAPPAFFERLVVLLLVRMGFGGSFEQAGRAIGRSGDHGVDGVIDQDVLGLDRVYVQAKRYDDGNTVGSGAIRDFFGSLDRHRASKGLFVTTSSFTVSARETAEQLSKRMVLVDGEMLARMMIAHDVGCRVEDTLHIKKLDEDFFE